jgi:3-dehydroquinate synthetase
MIGAAQLGMAFGVTPTDLVERQALLLKRFGLPDSYTGVEPDAILEAMSRDKKTSAGQISWIFLESIGHASVHRGVPQELVAQIVRGLHD